MLEKAVLIGLITPTVTPNQANEYLEELAFLAKTAGAKPVKNFTQRLLRADNKTSSILPLPIKVLLSALKSL